MVRSAVAEHGADVAAIQMGKDAQQAAIQQFGGKAECSRNVTIPERPSLPIIGLPEHSNCSRKPKRT